MSRDKKRIAEQDSEIKQLRSIIVELMEKIEMLSHPKKGRNSSVPPSKDENRPLRNQSLRSETDKKVGGQTGHLGTTLKLIDNPDKIILHEPYFCNNCGNDLNAIASEFVN